MHNAKHERDVTNSSVRTVSKAEYDESSNKYLEAYSFILSWGWKRALAHEDALGNKVYKWSKGEHQVDTVYEAQSIQRLRNLCDIK